MDARNQREWFTKSHEEKCDFIEIIFKDNSYRDEISPAEIDQLGQITFDIIKRRVSKIYDDISTFLRNAAEERAELKGITFSQAVEELAEIMKKENHQ